MHIVNNTTFRHDLIVNILSSIESPHHWPIKSPNKTQEDHFLNTLKKGTKPANLAFKIARDNATKRVATIPQNRDTNNENKM